MYIYKKCTSCNDEFQHVGSFSRYQAIQSILSEKFAVLSSQAMKGVDYKYMMMLFGTDGIDTLEPSGHKNNQSVKAGKPG